MNNLVIVMETNNTNKRVKAKKRVEKLKGFYTHLMFYLGINTILMVVKIIGNAYYGETFMGPLWHFSTFATWFFWGLGLAFHGVKVFYGNPFFNKNWEERQIKKYMNEDQGETEKYK